MSAFALLIRPASLTEHLQPLTERSSTMPYIFNPTLYTFPHTPTRRSEALGRLTATALNSLKDVRHP